MTQVNKILIQKTVIYTLSEKINLKSLFVGISEKKFNRIRHLRLMTLYESVTNGRTNGWTNEQTDRHILLYSVASTRVKIYVYDRNHTATHDLCKPWCPQIPPREPIRYFHFEIHTPVAYSHDFTNFSSDLNEISNFRFGIFFHSCPWQSSPFLHSHN